MKDQLERIIRPIVEGQIRGFLKEHPSIVDAVDWYKPRKDDKATTFINSLAKRIVRDLVCPIVRARMATALLEFKLTEQPESTVAGITAATDGGAGTPTGPADATERLLCEGFDRPECKPCWLVEDIQETTYDSAGILFTKRLCALCRSRLLRGEPQAWAA